MQVLRSRTLGVAAATGAVVLAAAGFSTAMAQLGPPPQTVYGSINDADGRVPEDVAVEAYIGDTECSDGKGRTGFTGEGDAEVTVYVVNVLDEAQRDGCGEPGADVTIKIGDKLAEQSVDWNAGIVRHDLTFGGVEPLQIPTVTPTPEGAQPTATSESGATSEPGTPAGTQTADPDPSATATQGGVSTNDPEGGGSGGDDDGDDGMPVWAIVALVLGGVAVVGGGVGYIVSRNNRDEDDPFAPPGNDSV